MSVSLVVRRGGVEGRDRRGGRERVGKKEVEGGWEQGRSAGGRSA